ARTIELLREIDVPIEKERKVEFFFYTNTTDKAEELAKELEKLNYETSHGKSSGDGKSFIVTGITTKMKMDDEIIANWAKEMCELGYKFDCDFDGWGTSPDQ